MSRRALFILLAGVCAVLFGAGLLRLLVWRFEVGDVYPEYSTFRTDPLGARALHDAVGSLPGLQAERFLLATPDLPDGRSACLLVLGLGPHAAASAEEYNHMEQFLAEGGRLVVAFNLRDEGGWRDATEPQHSTDQRRGDDGDHSPAEKAQKPPGQEPATPAAAKPAEEPPTQTPPPASARERRLPGPAPVRQPRPVTAFTVHWGLEVERHASGDGEESSAEPVASATGAARPGILPWSGQGAFKLRDPRWQAVCVVDGQPVVAERRIGSGTLVAVADTYLFSNEGLRQAPQPEFLSWILGPCTRVIFDETHLGVQSRQGLMFMARKYRLHGLFAAALALGLLFIWQSSARLVPAPPLPRDGEPALAARAAQSALRDLLRRHLPPDQLLDQCVDTWSRTAVLPHRLNQRTLVRLQERLRAYHACPRRQRDATACYRDLCDLSARKD